MDTNFSKEFLNPTFINITIDDGTFEYDEGDEKYNKNFVWNVTSFKDQILNISIAFEDPS